LINYTFSIDVNGKTITKKATNKNEFLRIVMLYAIGTYEEKLKVYNDLIKKAELLKLKQNNNE
jgi:hypothetical protein